MIARVGQYRRGGRLMRIDVDRPSSSLGCARDDDYALLIECHFTAPVDRNAKIIMSCTIWVVKAQK